MAENAAPYATDVADVDLYVNLVCLLAGKGIYRLTSCSITNYYINPALSFIQQASFAADFELKTDSSIQQDEPYINTFNMIFSRVFALGLRIAQFVFAVIVLGLTAYFLHAHNKYGVGPFARLVYSVVWSSLSIIASIIWAIPTTSSMTGYGSDFRKSIPPSSIKTCN